MRIEYFEAPWCGSCRGTKPHVIAACNKAQVSLDFIDCGNDGNAQYCVNRNIVTLPTAIIYSDEGTEPDRLIGSFGQAELSKRIAEAKGGE